MLMTMIQPTSSAQSVTGSFDSEESKYTVAGILSSFQSTGDNATPLNLSTSYTTTSTTDILTPTTLANLEQTFLELQHSVAQTQPTASLPRESGFVPPVVDPVRPSSSTVPQMVKQEYDFAAYNDDSSQDLDEEEWLPPSGKRARYDDSNAMMQSYVDESIPTTSTRRRKRGEHEHLTPEEDAKRHLRRERNKVAAAKCRQRRVDVTNTLITESEGLEEEQSKLENEIQMLAQQKEQLEFLLEAHRPVCSVEGLKSTSSTKPSNALSVKAETVDITYPSVLKTATVGTSTSQSPVTLSTSINSSQFSQILSRPNTLAIPNSKMFCKVTEATGVPITTPSGVFNIGLESMLDGHTGLTPITGAPSCASQLHRTSTDGSNSPSENLSSPTTLMAL